MDPNAQDGQQQQPGGPPARTRRQVLLWAGGILVALAFLGIVICGYLFNWKWTGLVTDAKYSKRTFWDWLSLLIVPIVLALGGYLFTRSENERTRQSGEEQRDLDRKIAEQRTQEDRKIAQERAETERQIADQRRQDDTLQAYIDQMSQLLLDKDRPLRQSKEGEEIRTLARARTLTVLRRLDGERKGRVLQFLFESGLIAKHGPVLDLGGCDLRGAELSYANLSEADLGGANLSGADLSGADLSGADLSWANLSNASLTFANLSNTDLTYAHLRNTNLTQADLINADMRDANRLGTHTTAARPIGADPSAPTGTDLSGANMSDADLSGIVLSGANLTAATVTQEQLASAALIGATMPDGQKYEDWLKEQEPLGGGENPSPW